MFPRRSIILGVALALFVLIAGCSGGTNHQGTSETGQKGATTTGAATHPGASTLTIAIPGDINNFDPYTNKSDTFQYVIGNTVFQTLVRYDENLSIEPGIATYKVNDSATRYTFKLKRNDYTFQDGTNLNAQAVVTSLKAAAKTPGYTFGAALQGVTFKATDQTTIEIDLKTPNAAFLDNLANVYLVSPKSLDNASKRPVGSGPFKFISWKANSHIKLKRWDGFKGKKPGVAQLVFKPVADNQVALNDLYAGGVDIVSTPDPSQIPTVNKSKVNVITPSESNRLQLVMVNTKTIPDKKVRQALAYSLDRQAIKKVVFNDGGEITSNPVSKSSWAFVTQDDYTYNLAKAKALFGQSKTGQQSIEYLYPSGYTGAKQIGRIWQASLAKIGVTLKLTQLPFASWLDRYSKQDYQLTWNQVDVSGPNSFFTRLGNTLAATFPNAQFNQLQKAAISTSDRDQRKRVYAKLERMVVEDVPILVVQTIPIYSLASKNVSGYAMNAIGWGLYRNVTLQ